MFGFINRRLPDSIEPYRFHYNAWKFTWELLPNKNKQIFRVHIKHYQHFDGVTPKTTHFSSHQAILTFSES